MVVHDYQYWQHKTTAETYAVHIVDGVPRHYTGPLYHPALALRIICRDIVDFHENPDDFHLVSVDLPTTSDNYREGVQ